MDIIEWIKLNRPGNSKDLPDRIEFAHQSGEHSTLWKRSADTDFSRLRSLGRVYEMFDGLDLFSSTFKFASISVPRKKNGVIITFTLQQIESECSIAGCNFPRTSVPFLYQAGVGYCAVDVVSGRIQEYDIEFNQYDEYDSLKELLDQWLVSIA